MDGVEIIERVEFAWDGGEIVEESTNNTVTVWDWQPGSYQPISQVERSGAQEWTDARFRAIVTDLVGMPTELVDEDGQITWSARNTVWGNGMDAGDGTPLRFPGQYHDQETGLYYNFHRYYDPEIGRYVSNDPLGLAPALDPHGYVLNPTAVIDPLGLAPCGTNKLGGLTTNVNLRPTDGTITSVKTKGRPPTNVGNKVSTGGHNEANVAGALQQGETILSGGKTLPPNHDLLKKPWELFDVKGVGNKLNTDVLRQHMMSMEDAYPKLFGPGGQFGRKDLIDQLEQANAVPADMIKELRNDPVPGNPQLGDKRPAEGSIADNVKRRRRAD